MRVEERELLLKNGGRCSIKSPAGTDALRMMDYMMEMSRTTDYMIRYPEESVFDLADEIKLIEGRAADERSAFIACFAGDEIIGNIGLYPVGDRIKLRHRCEIGLGISAAYRGMGVGSALLERAITLAKQIGYEQMELDVVSENAAAIALYEKYGFQKTGRIPNGMKRKEGGYYHLDYMVKDLLV